MVSRAIFLNSPQFMLQFKNYVEGGMEAIFEWAKNTSF
jgi:hypothetical protein